MKCRVLLGEMKATIIAQQRNICMDVKKRHKVDGGTPKTYYALAKLLEDRLRRAEENKRNIASGTHNCTNRDVLRSSEREQTRLKEVKGKHCRSATKDAARRIPGDGNQTNQEEKTRKFKISCLS